MNDKTSFQFNERGLIPAVVQDANTGEILMVAWMNEKALHPRNRSGPFLEPQPTKIVAQGRYVRQLYEHA